MYSVLHLAQDVVLFGLNATLPEARKMVAGRGMKLPPYPLLDQYVTRTGIQGLLANEFLVHPEKDGVFQKGRDIRDSILAFNPAFRDSTLVLTIRASDVPYEALGRRGIGMLVEPLDGSDGVMEENDGVVVHAKSIIVFEGMIQTPDAWVPGKPHETTRVPVAVSPEEFEQLPEEEKRWLRRIAGEGIRPLVRGRYMNWSRDHTRDALAYYSPGCSLLKVAGVPLQP